MDGGLGHYARLNHVIIIGGGASGVLMAAHLLQGTPPHLRVPIIERGAMLGCGIAYGTNHPDHLLNTRVAQMSAWPDRPDDFARWLTANGKQVTEQCFVDRATYGQYLSSLLDPWRAASGSPRLRCVQGACTSLRETDSSVVAHLDDGTSVIADTAILATGHAVPATPAPPCAAHGIFPSPPIPWQPSRSSAPG